MGRLVTHQLDASSDGKLMEDLVEAVSALDNTWTLLILAVFSLSNRTALLQILRFTRFENIIPNR